jgi:hypothetical protein
VGQKDDYDEEWRVEYVLYFSCILERERQRRFKRTRGLVDCLKKLRKEKRKSREGLFFYKVKGIGQVRLGRREFFNRGEMRPYRIGQL